MRVVVQRSARASVTISGRVAGSIARGLVVLVGFIASDTRAEVEWMVRKLVGLRVFPDDEDKMNLSIGDIGGQFLVVSQFTLYGDARKGNRPSFIKAAPPDIAIPLYDYFVDGLSQTGLTVQTGQFGAMMDVELINEGPVTLVIEK